jgi:hypothetical protein
MSDISYIQPNSPETHIEVDQDKILADLVSTRLSEESHSDTTEKGGSTNLDTNSSSGELRRS